MGDQTSELEGLIDEHRELTTLGASLRRARGGPEAEISRLLNELRARLAHHTEREEAGLFRVLRDVEVPEEYVGLFEHDHGHFVELIEAATRSPDAVEPLVKDLEGHMVKEETDMFPAAEQLLGPDDWDRIDAAVAHLR